MLPIRRYLLLVSLLTLSACRTTTGQHQSWPPEQPRDTSPATHPLPRSAQTGEARPLEAPPGQVLSSVPADVPRTAEEASGAAVQSLLAQSRAALAANRPDQGLSALERALRIEPRNPFVWQLLATAHLAAGQPDQAESTARKANSLARGNPYVEVETWKVIAAVKQEQGDSGSASEARARVDALNTLLGR
jgi:tetratricopeptide (TPR) repeat protein